MAITHAECFNRVAGIVCQMERATTGMRWEGREDMISEGMVGYAEANRTYRADNGALRWTHATPRIRGRILDAMGVRKRHRKLTRIPADFTRQEADPGSSIAELCANETGQRNGRSMESTLTARQASLLLARTLRDLGYKCRFMVVECGLKQRSVRAACKEVGLTRGQAGRLLKNGMDQIRFALESEGFCLADFM